MSREWPNILITGTPGTGKSAHAAALCSEVSSLESLNIGSLVKEQGLHSGWDEEWQSYDVDEDRLLDVLEPICGGDARGGKVLEWHVTDIFPERWIDLVVVLRCDHTKLWERMEKRGYPLHKIQENNEAEIMESILEEARESYAEEIVVELRSESPEEIDSNVERIKMWIDNWRRDQQDDD